MDQPLMLQNAVLYSWVNINIMGMGIVACSPEFDKIIKIK
jgi:hypothetical protein